MTQSLALYDKTQISQCFVVLKLGFRSDFDDIGFDLTAK